MVKTLPFSMRLDVELKERLQKLAAADHRSLTNLVEKVLLEYCDAHDRQKGERRK